MADSRSETAAQSKDLVLTRMATGPARSLYHDFVRTELQRGHSGGLPRVPTKSSGHPAAFISRSITFRKAALMRVW